MYPVDKPCALTPQAKSHYQAAFGGPRKIGTDFQRIKIHCHVGPSASRPRVRHDAAAKSAIFAGSCLNIGSSEVKDDEVPRLVPRKAIILEGIEGFERLGCGLVEFLFFVLLNHP